MRPSALRTAGVSTLLVGVLVLGLPLSAAAVTVHRYYAGNTIQNAIRLSSTVTMVGGRTLTNVLGIDARVTQSGVGSAQAPWLAEVTHSARRTYSYCQWRDEDMNWGSVKNDITCQDYT